MLLLLLSLHCITVLTALTTASSRLFRRFLCRLSHRLPHLLSSTDLFSTASTLSVAASATPIVYEQVYGLDK